MNANNRSRSAQRTKRLNDVLDRHFRTENSDLHTEVLVTFMGISKAQAKALIAGSLVLSEASLLRLDDLLLTAKRVLQRLVPIHANYRDQFDDLRLVGFAKVPRGMSEEEAQKLYEEGKLETSDMAPFSLRMLTSRDPH